MTLKFSFGKFKFAFGLQVVLLNLNELLVLKHSQGLSFGYSMARHQGDAFDKTAKGHANGGKILGSHPNGSIYLEVATE